MFLPYYSNMFYSRVYDVPARPGTAVCLGPCDVPWATAETVLRGSAMGDSAQAQATKAPDEATSNKRHRLGTRAS